MRPTVLDSTLGDIVARDYRAAAVLSRFGLDFCCGGKRTLDAACRAKHLDAWAVAGAVEGVSVGAPARPDTSWGVGELVDQIVDTHHAYAREALPRIANYLDKLMTVHGARRPELQQIAEHFGELGRALQKQIFTEEDVLFPTVRALHARSMVGDATPRSCFGTVRHSIRMMETAHMQVGHELEMIRELSNGFEPPADCSVTYRICCEELAAFDADLRRHIHLENNVLFPKAVRLEGRLKAEGGGTQLA
jgi:regulator of cell morphogenesis and NO signaling